MSHHHRREEREFEREERREERLEEREFEREEREIQYLEAEIQQQHYQQPYQQYPPHQYPPQQYPPQQYPPQQYPPQQYPPQQAYQQPPTQSFAPSPQQYQPQVHLAPDGKRPPIVVKGRFEHAHFFHHHGRLNYQVPAQFFIGRETEFREPGGELLLFRIPDDAQPGDDLIIEY